MSLVAPARAARDRAGVPKEPRMLCLANSRRGHLTQRVRGTVYAPFFEGAGWRATFLDAARHDEARILEAARDCDIVYLLKVDSLRLLERLKAETRALLVFDLTDRLWSWGNRLEGWHDLEAVLRLVDAVICENDATRDYALRHNPRVFVLPPSAQLESFDAVRSLPTGRVPGRVRIGWVGSRTTMGALRRVRGPLRALCARHPEVELRFVGATEKVAARLFKGLPYTVVPVYDEARMIRELRGLDIGLFPAPLGADDYLARGPLKALLYMAAGVPPVCEAGGDCSALLRDGVTGMLADSESAWEEKLERLIVSPELRLAMGEAALARAREGHSLRQSFDALREAFLSLIEENEESEKGRPRAARRALPARRPWEVARGYGYRLLGLAARIWRAL